MAKAWLKSLVAAMGLLGASQSALADTSNYTVYTNAAGDIYLKAPEQFVLIHSDVSVPLFTMPADGYLKVISNGNGTWQTVAISAAEWNSLGLYQGGNTVESLQYADMNGDGTADMFLALRGGGYLVIYRKKDGTFATSASPADVRLGTSFELKDVNGDGLLDVVSGGKVVSYGLGAYKAIYSGQPSQVQSAKHVGITSGEFRVDESGQVEYSIPVAMPAGIAEVMPSLDISYSGGGNSGIAGIGWNVSGSSMITRCAKTIAQDGINEAPQFRPTDAYCLDGQRLVKISGTDGVVGAFYRLEIDDFSRLTVTASDSYGPKSFAVTTKANETKIYGESTEDRMGSGTKNAVLYRSGSTIPVGWSIRKVSDSFSNSIEYRYINNSSSTDIKDSFLLSKIYYANYEVVVNINYEPSKVIKSGYQYGVKFNSNSRVKSVSVTDNNESFRFYSFVYDNSLRVDILNNVQECESENGSCKSALKFDYHIPSQLSISNIALRKTGDNLITPNSGTSFIDLDGDAKPDQVYQNKERNELTVIYSSNSLKKIVTSKLDVPDITNPNDNYNTTTFMFADINGDLIPDILYAEEGVWKYLSFNPAVTNGETCNSGFTGFEVPGCYKWSELGKVTTTITPFKLTTNAYSDDNQDPIFADVDGDGFVEWLKVISGTGGLPPQIRIYKNTNGNYSANSFDESKLPASIYAGNSQRKLRIKATGDVNGDGNTDALVQLQSCTSPEAPARCSYYQTVQDALLIGYKSQNQIQFQLTTVPGSFNQLVDLNRDGNDDLFNVEADGFTVAFSKGIHPNQQISQTNLFETAVKIKPSAYKLVKDLNRMKGLVRVIDIDFDGVNDVIAPFGNDQVVRLGVYKGQMLTDGSWNIQASANVLGEECLETRDKILPDGEVLQMCLPTGNFIIQITDNFNYQITDINNDSYPDLLTTYAQDALEAKWNTYSFGDQASYKAMPSFLLKKITNGYGAATEIEYGQMNDKVTYGFSDPNVGGNVRIDDNVVLMSSAPLVSRVKSDANFNSDGTKSQIEVIYKYYDLVVNKSGRGSLGFRKLRTWDKQSQILTTTTYSQTWPFIGKPLETVATLNDVAETVISKSSSYWEKKQVADNGLFVYLAGSLEAGWQVTSGGELKQVKKLYSTYEYDNGSTDNTAWGNITKTVTKDLYDFGNPQLSDSVNQTVTTFNTYEGWNSTNSKRFGRLSKTEVKQESPVKLNPTDATKYVDAAASTTRTSLFTYDPASGLLVTEEVAAECKGGVISGLSSRKSTDYCDSSNWRKITYSYNGAGLKTETKIETNAGVRYESVKFSSDNRYVIAKSDGASNDLSANVETYLYNGVQNPTGRIYELVTTSPNRLLTLTRFNEWGEGVETVDASGVMTETRLESCDTATGLAVYCRTTDQFITRTSRPGMPEQAEITDKLGRVSKKLAKGFDGNWKQTSVIFDAQGRLEKEYQAEPATNALPTSKFTSYSYDSFGRLTKTTNPDDSTTEVKYFGLTTSTKDEEGYWRDEENDSLGRTVFTSDPYTGAKPQQLGGVRQYYDAYGNNVRTDVLAMVDSTGKPAVGNNGVRVDIKVTETASFDRYGRRLSSTSASKGTWYYGYNGFGELISQQNGRGQLVTNSYDRLGRLLESNSDDGKVCYSYGTDPSKRNVGKLIELRSFGKDTACSTTAIPNYRETYAFDDLGRPAATETLQKGKLFQQMAFYDDIGRMYKQLLPGGVTVKQEYNAAGFQYKTIADNTVISEIKAMDDAGRVTQAAFVGGSKRSVEYTPERGFIKNIKVQDGLNNTLYTVDYGYNLRGDTKSRQSNYYNGTSSSLVNENYTYSTDGHFRLEKRDVAVTAPQVLGNLVTPMSQSFSYDSLGNLKTKSSVGTYEYDSSNPYLLRKTTGAAAGVRSYTMAGATDYDAHGNIKADGQRIFMYNQADMVFLIAKGIDSTKFDYAPDNSRIYREDTRSGSVTKTWYVGKTYEYSEKGSITEQRWYIGNVVMSQSSKTSGTNFEVLHGDAQGSTVTVTDGSGKLVSHSLYDAWGQQSVLQVGPPSQLFIQSLQRRGYTGHENVEGLGIIHMNGRIYDPLLARFVQADPTLQFAQLSQGYNRYSYVLNNPMTYTDPSGYFVKWLMKKTGVWSVLRDMGQVPVFDIIASMYIAALCTPAGATAQCYATSMAVFQSLKTYAVTGSLKAGVRAGALSFATAHISNAIGGKYQFAKGGMNSVLNVFSHSMVGGVSAVVQGGKFGHGFLSSMVSTSLKGFMDPSTTNLVESPYTRTLIAGLVGGTVSSLTGGKFANGALTSSIQWWMNAEQGGELKKRLEARANIQSLLNKAHAGKSAVVDDPNGIPLFEKAVRLGFEYLGRSAPKEIIWMSSATGSASWDALRHEFKIDPTSKQFSSAENLISTLGHEIVHMDQPYSAEFTPLRYKQELEAWLWEKNNLGFTGVTDQYKIDRINFCIGQYQNGMHCR